jgi:curved DNA-binding protein CbpA
MKDPYHVLGVTRNAADEEIHRAYLAKVQEFPPDREPGRFQEVRRAYEAVKERRLRLKHDLFNSEPPERSDLLEIALTSVSPRRPDEKLIRKLVGATGAIGRSKGGR